MPELPDVEIFRRYLAATSLHRAIVGIETAEAGLLRGTSPSGLGRRLAGRSFSRAVRHGKHLLALVDDGRWLVFHFGMTGSLKAFDRPDGASAEDKVTFKFRDGRKLAYRSSRKLGWLEPCGDYRAYLKAKKLGPDALDGLDRDEFVDLARQRRGGVKAALMNQSFLAGVGNVYSDEVLFQSRLHPRAALNALSEKKLAGLHSSLGQVLAAAIEAGADPANMPDHFLLPHRRRGGACPACGRKLAVIKINGRRGFYCPRHQPPPKS